jgi:hypothetical protein
VFRAHSIRDIQTSDGADYVTALVGKLQDIENHRIAANDALVIRKAVLGLLEIVSDLECRIAALEKPGTTAEWTAKLEAAMHEAQPEYVTRDDKETASGT